MSIYIPITLIFKLHSYFTLTKQKVKEIFTLLPNAKTWECLCTDLPSTILLFLSCILFVFILVAVILEASIIYIYLYATNSLLTNAHNVSHFSAWFQFLLPEVHPLVVYTDWVSVHRNSAVVVCLIISHITLALILIINLSILNYDPSLTTISSQHFEDTILSL